jgi:hypothetical protein
MRRWQSYTLVGAQSGPDGRRSMQIKVAALTVFVVWLQYYCSQVRNAPVVGANAETYSVQTPAIGFVITMDNESGHKAAKVLQLAFRIQEMHVVMGHVGNYSTLSLYNRHLMRHGRTDGLQIGNTRMLGCLESHREVWTRVQQDSYVFEDDAMPVENALRIVKTLLLDNAVRPRSVIHLDVPGGFISGNFLWPDWSQFTNIGKITETCRDCVAFSTCGYIITKEAAQILIQNYEPPVVQVDAYMSLLHAYHPHFRQAWTRVRAIDQRPHTSSTQNYRESLNIFWTISNILAPQH